MSIIKGTGNRGAMLTPFFGVTVVCGGGQLDS